VSSKAHGAHLPDGSYGVRTSFYIIENINVFSSYLWLHRVSSSGNFKKDNQMKKIKTAIFSILRLYSWFYTYKLSEKQVFIFSI